MSTPTKRDARLHDCPQQHVTVPFSKVPLCYHCNEHVREFHAFQDRILNTVTFIAKCCGQHQEEVFPLADYQEYKNNPDLKAFYAFKPKDAPPPAEVLPAENPHVGKGYSSRVKKLYPEELEVDGVEVLPAAVLPAQTIKYQCFGPLSKQKNTP